MAGTTNMFSVLLTEDVGHVRRVAHSAKNYFQTVHMNPFGDHSSVNLDNMTSVGGQAMNVLGVVAGSAAIGFATSAVATGAFAAAVAGPQAAVSLGVISIAMALKSAYSNREKSHKVLSRYVYNMVDDVPPPAFTTQSLKEAAQAANYLLSEGQNQFELVSSKYQAASKAFTVYMGRLDARIFDFDAKQQSLRPLTLTAPARNKILAEAADIKRQALAEFRAAKSPGGAIFEFVRRCAHTGNYLQAPHIMHLAIMEQLQNGAVINTQSAHASHFHNAPLVTVSRQMFQQLHDKYDANAAVGKIFR